jgi:hypothetical protein
MTTHARHWSEISPAPLSLEAIRELHVPPSHYRISPNRYEAGVAFPGTTRAGRLYVLSGACSKMVGKWEVALRAGMFADFPAGNFEFKVLGEQQVQLVNVWLIPEQYRAKGDA